MVKFQGKNMLRLLMCIIIGILVNGIVESKTKYDDNSQIIPVVTISPNYPTQAALDKIEGFVVLQFTVNETGSVEDPKVIDSHPPLIFDKEAIRAIKKYKFAPARTNHKPVKQEATQRIEFKLSALPKISEEIFSDHNFKKPYVDYDLRYSTKKNGKFYQHVLTIRNTKTDTLVKTMNLRQSYKREGVVLRGATSQYFFYYYETKNGQANIEIVDLETYKVKHKFNVEKLMVDKDKDTKLGFYYTTSDPNRVLMQVGAGVNQKLINLDAVSGKVVSSYMIGKQKIIIKIKGTKDFVWIIPGKKQKNGIGHLFRANTLEKVQDFQVNGKIVKTSVSEGFLFFIEKQFDGKRPKEKSHSVKIIDLKNNKVFSDYTSSSFPKIQIIDKKIYLIGRSIKKPHYLKIVKFENEVYEDISNTSIDAVIETFEATVTSERQILTLFGKKSVVSFDLLNPDKSSSIATPFKIDGGIVSEDAKKVFVKADFGAKIGLADFHTNRFVGYEHTGSKGKKVGNALLNLLTMVATSSTGYVLVPGVKLSKNTLMLSKNQKILFAINSKTHDVTVFDADDLGNKRIYPTGKNAFQILQAGHEDDLPVVIISQKQVTYFDANTGEQISKVSYDKFIKITDDLNLLYQKNKTNHSIALYKIP